MQKNGNERKVRLYRKAGAREYRIVDAETKTVKLGRFEDLWLCLVEMDLS